MAKAKGSDSKIALVKGATWGTAVAAGARNRILVKEFDIPLKMEDMVDDSISLPRPTSSDAGARTVSGDLPMYARYGMMDLLLYLLMGTSAQPTYTTPTQTGTAESGTANTLTDTDKSWTTDAYAGKWVTLTGGTGSGQTRRITSNTATALTVDANWATNPGADTTYEISGAITTHAYTLAANRDGLFACLAAYNGINVVEYPSAKVAGLTLSGKAGAAIEATFRMIASDYQPSSAVNTSATMATTTVPTYTSERVLFKNVASQVATYFRINDASGATLDSGDVEYPNSFELNIEHAMRGDYGTSAGFDTIDEPAEDDLTKITLTLGFPSYTAKTKFTDWLAGTAKKAEFYFQGQLLGGSTYASMKIQFPNLKYSDVSAPFKRGIIEHPVSMNCLDAVSAVSGITDTGGVSITMVNGFGGQPSQAGNI